jgi:hypothetical protein
VCAWVFLAGEVLLGASDRAWLHAIALSGSALFALASLALHAWERRHSPQASGVGLWLGCSALVVFLLLAVTLPALHVKILVRAFTWRLGWGF